MAINTCTCTGAEIGAPGSSYNRCNNPLVTFAGAVLATFERNGYDDSDFFAVVWDGEMVREVEYASTRGWTYHNGAQVDATDDVTAAALAWYRVAWLRGAIAGARADAAAIEHGRVVRSTTTRGKNVGVVGTVEWIGDDRYARHYSGPTPKRVGIHVDGERDRRYLPASSVVVVTPDEVDEAPLIERAKTVTPANWQSAMYAGVGHLLAAMR